MSESKLNQLMSQAENQMNSGKFKEFWATIQQINDLSRDIKLSQSFRKELRDWQNEWCGKAKGAMEARDRSRKDDSASKRRLVETTIHEAMSVIAGAESPADFNHANNLLAQASERMKNGYYHGFDLSHSLTVHEGRLTKEDRESCNQLWREAKNSIGFRRKEIHSRNFQHFRQQASSAYNLAQYGHDREAKDMVTEIQADLKTTSMTADQFQIIRDVLNQTWQTATLHQRAKHTEWVHKTQEYIDRTEVLIDKNEDVIVRLESQIDDCENMLADAKSSDFAYKVQGWIDEKRRKIEDIQATNRELHEKVSDARSRLNN